MSTTFHFIGTAAADYDWSRYGEPGILGSCCTLLDGHILVDCGTTALPALRRYQVSLKAIDTLLVTHSHSDHFRPEAILELAQECRKPLAVYASPEALARLSSSPCLAAHPLVPEGVFQVGDYAVTPVVANHLLEHPEEHSFNFIFDGRQRRFLYALDTGPLLKRTVQLLQNHRLDLVIWDGTMSYPGDWRYFDHSDPATIRVELNAMIDQNAASHETRVILDHHARTLWPETPEARRKIAQGFGFDIAEDNTTFTLK